MFGTWHRYKEGKISWSTFQSYVRPVRAKIEALLLRGQNSGHPRLVGMCKELHSHRDWLWTFTRVEGVEPTNNTAERALRPAVIWRKLSFGTQSEKGSRFMERMLSVTETCRLQKRPIFEYMVQALQAHFSKTKPPSLISDR